MSQEPLRPADLRPLSEVMPPLLLGTATFNTQYVDDPAHMPYRDIVRRALVDLDVRGFDTSPYYGPSEELLGEALEAAAAANGSTPIPRSQYFVETKAGRVHSNGFDYSPVAVHASVQRSLRRLRTSYVDLVYTHDAEFVSPEEVVEAVRELRRMRSSGELRYIGISGYPVQVLVDLAERILRETGEPVDAVLSYGHCTIQNTQLVGQDALTRLQAAGVSVVLNASLLNMGLLTTRGVATGPLAAWHPSPPGLRAACAEAAQLCQTTHHDGTSSGIARTPLLHPPNVLERIALRYALDVWARTGAAARLGTTSTGPGLAVGPSVLGVTSVGELTETVLEWWSVLDGLQIPHATLDPATTLDEKAAARQAVRRDDSLRRSQQVASFVREKLWPILGKWKDYAWASPSEGWVNELKATATDS